MPSLRGLAAFARQNNMMGDPLIVNVGGVNRCMVAEMAPNVLATAAGEGPVPQIRFICDGYCGLSPKRASKVCRTVDRAATPTNVPQPPGFVGVGSSTAITTPYRSGAGAVRGVPASPGSFAAPPGFVRRALVG